MMSVTFPIFVFKNYYYNYDIYLFEPYMIENTIERIFYVIHLNLLYYDAQTLGICCYFENSNVAIVKDHLGLKYPF